MKPRLERLLLIFSVAVNVAFLTTAAVRQRHAAPSREAESSEGFHFSSGWQGHRAAALDHRLHLQRHQRRMLREHLGSFRPELETTRRELVTARRRFREALRRDDAAAVRAARQQVSRVQTQLDSLTAEAMLAEIEVLQPEQRERYVRWTFERPRSRSWQRSFSTGEPDSK